MPDNPPTTLTSPVADFLSDTNGHVVPRFWTMQNGTRIVFNIEKEEVSVGDTLVPGRSVVILGTAP